MHKRFIVVTSAQIGRYRLESRLVGPGRYQGVVGGVIGSPELPTATEAMLWGLQFLRDYRIT